MEEFLRSLLRNALRILRQIHAPNVVEDFIEKLKQNLIIIEHKKKYIQTSQMSGRSLLALYLKRD